MIDQTSQFFAILTDIGAAKQANANALRIPWVINDMEVGDANGTDPTPNPAQTRLIRERRRAPLNRLSIDPANPAIIIAEQVLPADVGGWWIREIGLRDADGDLVAIANCPPSFKPLLTQGSGRTQIVRINLVVSNSSNVQLSIDPSIVLATHGWVADKVTQEINKLDRKQSVRAVATAPITLRAAQTIDGIALVAGDRVLVTKQAAGKDNGLYLVAAANWRRAPDADTNAEVTPGLFVSVEQGDLYGDSLWQLVTDGAVVLGTTALTFELLAGRSGIAAGTYRSVTVDKNGRVTGGTNPTKLADYKIDVATQQEAEAGAENTKPVTALRVFQAIAKKVVQATETVLGLAKVATQAQAEAGTDDRTFVSPKKMRAGFAASMTTQGYIALPSWLGGWILQWGFASIPGVTTSVVTNLPIAFPNTALASVSSDGGNTCFPSGVSNTSRSTLTVYAAPFITNSGAVAAKNSNANIRWLAIGR